MVYEWSNQINNIIKINNEMKKKKSGLALCQPVKPALLFRQNHRAPLWMTTLTNIKNESKVNHTENKKKR